MSRSCVVFSLLAVFVASGILADEGSLDLAVNGKSSYTIVRPAESSPSQIYAAEELQRFTKQMTGAELPIATDETPLPPTAILLGMTRYTEEVLGKKPNMQEIGDDGFRLTTRTPHMLIIGSPVRGTLYGVYELLERYGDCRWYAKHHASIPRRDTWTLPKTDQTQVPAFPMREPFWWGMFDGDFAARCKVNGNRPNLADNHGGKIRFGSGLFVHTFYPLMPPSEFFADHPEYYSEINGKRKTERAQLCLTNPDVVRIVTDRVLARIRQDPHARLFSVSQNDWAGWCQCENCRHIDEQEGSPSGTMIHFVNQVAEAVEQEFPHVWIETLAYQYTRHPPKTIKPRHNVVPRLCTIECDFSKPLDVSTYEQNQKFVEDIKGWSAITDKLYVWDYTTNFGHYVSPHPNFACLQGNAKFFRDHRVVGLFEQGAYQAPHAEFAELRAWVLAKLLWDPDQNLEALYTDFFAGYYGPAAVPIREYFDELQSLVREEDAVLRIWYPPTAGYYSDEFFARAASLWAKAEGLVKDDPQFSYNVRMSALPVMYAQLERWPTMDISHEWRDEMLKPTGVDPEYAELANEFLSRLDEGKVSHVSESKTRHDDYVHKLRGRTVGFLPVSVNHNKLVAKIVPQSGARVVHLSQDGNPNCLLPAAGGIDFVDVSGDMTAIDRSAYGRTSTQSQAASFRRDIRHRYRIDRNVRVGENGLTLSATITSNRNEPQTIQPVFSVAMPGDQAVALLDTGTDTWTSLVVPPNQTTATLTIPGTDLRSHSLLFAGSDPNRGVRVDIPTENVLRIWLRMDKNMGSTRVFVILRRQDLPAHADRTFSLAVQPGQSLSGPAVPTLETTSRHQADRVVIDDCLMKLGRLGEWGEPVADHLAEDGFAIKLFNTHYEWCLQWPIDSAQFEPNVEYKLRVRIRVEKTDRAGAAFWAGVYDQERKRGWGQIQPQTSEVQDGYQWYDVATWTPESQQYIWVGPGMFPKDGGRSAIQAVYVDQFELTRVPSSH